VRYLLRTLETREGGSVEYRDNEFVSDVITIGRATDQDIQLTDTGVELEHARIGQRMGGKAQIKSLSVSGVSINDDVVSAGTLKIGDVIKIGDSTLEIISPPPGFDFALTLARGEGVEPEGEPGAQYVTSLEQTKLSKRKWSWVLFIVIVVLFMGLPVAGLLNEGLRDILRSTPLPSDNVWDSGPLIPAHRIPELAGNCNACHAIPFRMVNNKECLACHKDVGKHADEEAHNTPELTEARCESCHKEHNEPAAIVRTDEALCVDCHGDLKANTPAETRLRNARNFGTDHPSFRLTTLVPQNKGKDTTWKAVRLDQDGTGLVEQSNLKFSHKAHLDPKGVEAPEGQVILQCEDCHQLDGAGKLMQTIQMEQICRRCHALVIAP
jgi:predicted CXXCH cytochrome family protein